MKNALTKTLLCGVMATTFFLINCQKAPSRGIKGKTAGPAAADTAGKGSAAEVIVECTSDFPNFLKASNDAVDLLKTQKLTDLTEAEKTKLIEDVKAALQKVKETVAEITKVDAKATGCAITDKATKKQGNPYLKAHIEIPLNKIILNMKDQGIVIDGVTEAAEKAKEEAKAKREKETRVSLVVDMEFIVSEQLIAELKKVNAKGVVYFKAGGIVTRPSTETYEKDKADLKLSMCQIGDQSNDAEKGVNLKVMNIAKQVAAKNTSSKRYELNVKLAGGAALINLDCFIADGKQNESEKEFRFIFGNHLMTKEYKDNEAKKEETKKTAVETAKSDLAKKTELATAASQALLLAKQEYDSKMKEIDAAKEKKDKELTEKLVEAAGPVKEKMEKAQKDSELADKAKVEAEETLKKAESAVAKKSV